MDWYAVFMLILAGIAVWPASLFALSCVEHWNRRERYGWWLIGFIIMFGLILFFIGLGLRGIFPDDNNLRLVLAWVFAGGCMLMAVLLTVAAQRRPRNVAALLLITMVCLSVTMGAIVWHQLL